MAAATPATNTDAFGGAESSTEAQKRALLAAVAQQGTAGRQAYDAQAKAAEEARKQAVQAAGQRANAIQAPAALTQQLQTSAAELPGRYATDAAAATQAYGREQARETSANSSYMDQVKAAIPLVQAVAQARRAAEAEKASTGPNYAGKGQPLADLVHGLGGSSLAKAQLAPALGSVVEHARSTRPLAGNRTTSGARTPFNVDAGANDTDAIDNAGRKLGLEPGTLQKLLGKDSPDYVKPVKHTKTVSPAKVREVRSDNTYRQNAKALTAKIKELRTPIKDGKGKVTTPALDMGTIKAQLRAAILSDPKYASNPVLYEQLIKDFL